MEDGFEWPWHYKFPPFFTIQPNSDTRARQLDLWCSLVLSYFKHKKSYIIDVNEAQTSPLFSNKDINRKLSAEGINLVLETLQKKGNFEWESKKGDRGYVMWRKPEEWGSLIYEWVKDNAMTGSVCTLFELQHGDDTKKEEFHGIDMWMLKRALKSLEVKNKAKIFEGPTPGDDNGLGVKFFS
ncbi:vacuolar protein-sorting-associated protein 25-like [Xenia sp. Carnegie-2017]|uniref:vacuolar protein-sorting-associated protein 25-like n=1 Tax=Xenia sp. Carnegie-2017 TaxID=2897299 RepID=UPI001F039777|nr:vacuolar protein-sorting-associated protein 25-like [Xenia sp. Carnegie-2017]